MHKMDVATVYVSAGLTAYYAVERDWIPAAIWFASGIVTYVTMKVDPAALIVRRIFHRPNQS